MKQYLVSELRLKNILSKYLINEDVMVEIENVKEKLQPVELVASGEVGYNFNGYTINKKIISDIDLGGHLHKNIKIYIERKDK